MPRTFSLYLDTVRFFAALAVFLCHVAFYPFTDHVVWWRLGTYGDVAVTIFFVLSGYVIAHVSSTRERNAKDYFSARIARLYSVVGVGLILTFLFDSAGSHLNPNFYTIQTVLWKPESWAGYLSSAAFVNEFQILGFHGISPGTNAPYWSLSFEAAYYVVAGALLFFPKRLSIPISLLVLALGGKTIAALLPIWAMGFFLCRKPLSTRIPSPLALGVTILSAVVILSAPTIATHFANGLFGIVLPWGRGPFNRNIIGDYITAVAFAAHIAFARVLFSRAKKENPARFVSAVRWLGSLTFPLYCFHYPAICLLAAISPWPRTTMPNLIFICTLSLSMVIVITPYCDHLKQVIRVALSGARDNAQLTLP